jgi:dCMP deaminase
MTRPAWDETWMRVAYTLAERSADPRLKVGCVIVSPDNRYVLGVGYNGDEAGGENVVASLEPGQSGFVHAEVNALIKTRETEDASVYVTHSPCAVCARALVNARVRSVTYSRAYRDEAPLELLMRHGIEVKCSP